MCTGGRTLNHSAGTAAFSPWLVIWEYLAMNPSQASRDDFEFLLENARVGRSLGLTHFSHLDQPIGIRSYIRIADDIARQIPSGDVLDWGCGYGQMTYLLKRRGLRVTSYDIGDSDKTVLHDIPLSHDLDVVYATHPTDLPFPSGTFDAVLSCGVLEHVDEFSRPGNERKSLDEIARVVRPGGHLFIYQLPQLHAWQEALVRRLHLGYSHPRRYSAAEVSRMLQHAGFSVQGMRRANLVPKNLTVMPRRVRIAYSRFGRRLLALDGMLCKIPVLNRLAGVFEITARRRVK